jgi:superfamily II DNA or RNA helicase
MVTSRKEVEQAVGRVIRKIDPNIRPTIYDFTDQLPSFVNQGYSRRRLYKKMGFEIKIIDVNNNEIIHTKDLCEIKELSDVQPNETKIDNAEIDFID